MKQYMDLRVSGFVLSWMELKYNIQCQYLSIY